MSAAKRGMGRPKLFDGDAERKTVHLLPEVVAKVEAIGDGSLSQGIDRLAYRVPDKPAEPALRYVTVTDPEIIAAIIHGCETGDIKAPIGGFVPLKAPALKRGKKIIVKNDTSQPGFWIAERHSLDKYLKRPVEFDV